jgi:hypothetical protein
MHFITSRSVYPSRVSRGWLLRVKGVFTGSARKMELSSFEPLADRRCHGVNFGPC